jgi:hypothetical protein
MSGDLRKFMMTLLLSECLVAGRPLEIKLLRADEKTFVLLRGESCFTRFDKTLTFKGVDFGRAFLALDMDFPSACFEEPGGGV